METRDPRLDVFRDLIEEERRKYSVGYQPIDARCHLAELRLVFPHVPEDRGKVSKAMEEELEFWLKKFPVPVKVTAFDASGKIIALSPNLSESHLTGYVRLADEAIVRRWNLMDERELPAETLSAEHLRYAYAKIPGRVREEVRVMERLESRERTRAICLTLGLMLVFPLFLQAVVVWGYDLVVPLIVVSFVAGMYKGAAVMGLRKPSWLERRRSERIATREYYFFHCEKNPKAFDRLEEENFQREVDLENEKAERLLQDRPARTRKSRFRTLPRLFRAKV